MQLLENHVEYRKMNTKTHSSSFQCDIGCVSLGALQTKKNKHTHKKNTWNIVERVIESIKSRTFRRTSSNEIDFHRNQKSSREMKNKQSLRKLILFTRKTNFIGKNSPNFQEIRRKCHFRVDLG